MHRNAIKFKDTWAAPGSQLHAALEDRDLALARKIYDQCEEDNRLLLEKVRQTGFKKCSCLNLGYCDGSCAPYNGGGGPGSSKIGPFRSEGGQHTRLVCDVDVIVRAEGDAVHSPRAQPSTSGSKRSPASIRSRNQAFSASSSSSIVGRPVSIDPRPALDGCSDPKSNKAVNSLVSSRRHSPYLIRIKFKFSTPKNLR